MACLVGCHEIWHALVCLAVGMVWHGLAWFVFLVIES